MQCPSCRTCFSANTGRIYGSFCFCQCTLLFSKHDLLTGFAMCLFCVAERQTQEESYIEALPRFPQHMYWHWRHTGHKMRSHPLKKYALVAVRAFVCVGVCRCGCRCRRVGILYVYVCGCHSFSYLFRDNAHPLRCSLPLSSPVHSSHRVLWLHVSLLVSVCVLFACVSAPLLCSAMLPPTCSRSLHI
jgi:hypothetical protein